jgi:hypothetical protein
MTMRYQLRVTEPFRDKDGVRGIAVHHPQPYHCLYHGGIDRLPCPACAKPPRYLRDAQGNWVYHTRPKEHT